MIIDYQMLGERLTSAGLTGKPVNEYSKQEVEALVEACIDAIQPEQQTEYIAQPYIDAKGRLCIPPNCDPRFHWWKGCGMSILEILRELKAPEEVVRKYVRVEELPPF